MEQATFVNRVKSVVANACELSEAWIGTVLADKLSTETEALVRGVEDGKLEHAETILLPQLLKTVGFADNQLEHMEG